LLFIYLFLDSANCCLVGDSYRFVLATCSSVMQCHSPSLHNTTSVEGGGIDEHAQIDRITNCLMPEKCRTPPCGGRHLTSGTRMQLTECRHELYHRRWYHLRRWYHHSVGVTRHLLCDWYPHGVPPPVGGVPPFSDLWILASALADPDPPRPPSIYPRGIERSLQILHFRRKCKTPFRDPRFRNRGVF